MTGLLMKDIRLMKNQGRFFLGIIVFAVLMMFATDNPVFIVSYLTFICSFFALSVISYDETGNGYSFLFTLPVSRKVYVLEKYLFTLLLTLVSAAGSFLLMCAGCIIRRNAEVIPETAVPTLALVAVILIYLSILMPIHMKFGAEKGKLLMFAVLAGIMVLIFLLAKLLRGTSVDQNIDQILYSMKGVQIGVAAAVVCAAVMMISYFCAVRIMKNKEF